MDVFELRQTLISKYQDYVRSFIRIRNSRIERLVNEELEQGLLWPRPLVQLNPFFERGKSIPGMLDFAYLCHADRNEIADAVGFGPLHRACMFLAANAGQRGMVYPLEARPWVV